MLADAQCDIREAAADGLDFRHVAPAPVELAPSPASSRTDGWRKLSIALIDEFPLRRTTTLNMLSRHFRDGMQPFASSAEFLVQASTAADAPSALVKCVGRRSVADTPLLRNLHLIHCAFPALPVIILSDREEVEEVVATYRNGIHGYIPTSFPPRLVVNAIRIVLAGGTFYPATALIRAHQLIQPETEHTEFPDQVTAEHREQWPPRQIAVLRLLAQGRTNRQIARTLAIEEGTVKVHLRQIMRKLGAANRTQVALAARRLGLPATSDDTLATALRPDVAPAPIRPAWLNDLR